MWAGAAEVGGAGISRRTAVLSGQTLGSTVCGVPHEGISLASAWGWGAQVE